MWNFVHLEPIVAGCPNRCRHCSESGGPPFGELMSVDDAKWVIDEFVQAFNKGLGYVPTIWPWLDTFEPTAHPRFLELKAFEMAFLVERLRYNLLSTSGYGLARLDDWHPAYEELMAMGFEGIGYAIHGLEEGHDWFVRRKGAYRDLMTAVKRAREVGMTLSVHIYPTKRNLDTFKQVVIEAKSMAGESANLMIGTAAFYANERLREYEATLRISKAEGERIAEVLPMAQEMCQKTEAIFAQHLASEGKKACPYSHESGGKGPAERSLGRLQVTPDFDVSEVFHTRANISHGNLKRDGMEVVWQSIVDAAIPGIPEPEELANRYGDFTSDLLHPTGDSVYMKLCDKYWQEKRK